MEQFNDVTGLNQYYKALRKAVLSLTRGELIYENTGITILRSCYESQISPGTLAGRLYKDLVFSFQQDEEVISLCPLLAEDFENIIQKYYNQIREGQQS